ncbi:hypothetical protein [Embleya sp. AB8]|uniref:hypothetical protein n=1 Tax=Embleya sp. AB8 TaxID=3156304 RepID=UPI003C71655F
MAPTIVILDGCDDDTHLGELLTVRQVADLAGVSESAVRNWKHKVLIRAAGTVNGSPCFTVREAARCEKARRDSGKAPLRSNPMIAALQIRALREHAA